MTYPHTYMTYPHTINDTPLAMWISASVVQRTIRERERERDREREREGERVCVGMYVGKCVWELLPLLFGEL